MPRQHKVTRSASVSDRIELEEHPKMMIIPGIRPILNQKTLTLKNLATALLSQQPIEVTYFDAPELVGSDDAVFEEGARPGTGARRRTMVLEETVRTEDLLITSVWKPMNQPEGHFEATARMDYFGGESIKFKLHIRKWQAYGISFQEIESGVLTSIV